MDPQNKCDGCRNDDGFDMPITMALQPIFNITDGRVFAQEALVRRAGEVLDTVSDQKSHAFDQACPIRSMSRARASASR